MKKAIYVFLTLILFAGTMCVLVLPYGKHGYFVQRLSDEAGSSRHHKTAVETNTNKSRWHINKERLRHLESACQKMGVLLYQPVADLARDERLLKNLLVDDKHQYIYCPIAKVASTSWKRMYLNLARGKSNSTVYESVHIKNSFIEQHRLNQYSLEERKFRLKHYFKFFAVREPFERLLAAYNDKFTTKMFKTFPHWEKIARKIIQFTDDNALHSNSVPAENLNVTLEMFVNFITTGELSHYETHWTHYTDICSPCSLKYNFLAHFETLKPDSDYILKVVGADTKFMEKNSGLEKNRWTHTDTKLLLLQAFRHLPCSQWEKLASVYADDFALFNYKPRTC